MQSCGAVWAVNLLSKGDASGDFSVHVHGFCEWWRLYKSCAVVCNVK